MDPYRVLEHFNLTTKALNLRKPEKYSDPKPEVYSEIQSESMTRILERTSGVRTALRHLGRILTPTIQELCIKHRKRDPYDDG